MREAWLRREPGRLSLADGLVDGGARRNRQRAKIAALVDWAAFEQLPGEGLLARRFARAPRPK